MIFMFNFVNFKDLLVLFYQFWLNEMKVNVKDFVKYYLVEDN